MRNIRMLSMALVAGISLSACSSSTADDSSYKKDLSISQISTHHQEHIHHHSGGKDLEDDYQVVNFMDENFDMSKIEKRSCCDE